MKGRDDKVAGMLYKRAAVATAILAVLAPRLSVEPHSGAPLFHMDVRLRLPPSLSADAVQAALEAISAEIMVDISLTSGER